MNVVFDAYHSRNHRHKLGTCRLKLRCIRDIIKRILVQVMDLDPARELQKVVQYKMGGRASKSRSKLGSGVACVESRILNKS